MLSLAAKYPKQVLQEDVEAVFEKIVEKYGHQYTRATLRKVHDKIIARLMEEGKLIVA